MDGKRIIPGTEIYEIDIFGNIRSIDRIRNGRKIKGQPVTKIIRKCGNKEYYYCALTVNGKTITKGLHSFVAMTFPEICGEWFDGCQVHHIDKNTKNNCAYNLQVVSKEEHKDLHKYDITSGKGVYKYDLKWNFIERFDNVKYAAASVCGSEESLRQALNLRKCKTSYYKGYYWLYE